MPPGSPGIQLGCGKRLVYLPEAFDFVTHEVDRRCRDRGVAQVVAHREQFHAPRPYVQGIRMTDPCGLGRRNSPASAGRCSLATLAVTRKERGNTRPSRSVAIAAPSSRCATTDAAGFQRDGVAVCFAARGISREPPCAPAGADRPCRDCRPCRLHAASDRPGPIRILSIVRLLRILNTSRSGIEMRLVSQAASFDIDGQDREALLKANG